MYKALLKFIFIPLWFGFLVLPFMGIKGAISLALVILCGKIIFLKLARLKAVGCLKKLVESVSASLKKTDALIGRNHLFINLTILASLIILPFFLNNYYIDVLTLAGLYAVLALGLNISVGLAGLLDLGYIAFYAIGAYAYALLSTKVGISFWLALPIGGLFAACVGFILGIITLRLRGDYLAIVTLGFIHIVHLILNNWDSLTGGPNGILGIARPSLMSFKFNQPIHFYYLILTIATITMVVISRLNNSRIGRAWIAMREDEIAAEAMGIDTTRMKCLAFSLGAFWAGIAGVFFASYRMLIFGAALVAMMVFRPQGLIGSPRRKVELHPEDEKIYIQEMESLYEVEKQ